MAAYLRQRCRGGWKSVTDGGPNSRCQHSFAKHLYYYSYPIPSKPPFVSSGAMLPTRISALLWALAAALFFMASVLAHDETTNSLHVRQHDTLASSPPLVATRQQDTTTTGDGDAVTGPGPLRQRQQQQQQQPHDGDEDEDTTTSWPARRDEPRAADPPATSAAPKIFGISLYLVIAYLILLYLMYRTGSLF